MGGKVPKRRKPRALLVHWKEAETPEPLARLREAGFEPDYRTLTVAPVRAVREAAPDVLVIDLSRLPSHGLAIGIAARQSAALRRTPLVFVGGRPEKVSRVRRQLPDAVYARDWDAAAQAIRSALDDPPASPTVPASPGYSGRPLAAKLGIRAGDEVAIPGAPGDFATGLGTLPPDARIRRPARGGADLIVWFPRGRADFERRLGSMAGLARRWLWVAWRKRSAVGDGGDLDGNVVRRLGLAAGLVDSKVCAIDATWSALRFTRRRN